MNSRENGISNALAVAMDKNARGMNPFSDRASCCIHFTWGCLETLSDLPPLLDALENVLNEDCDKTLKENAKKILDLAKFNNIQENVPENQNLSPSIDLDEEKQK